MMPTRRAVIATGLASTALLRPARAQTATPVNVGSLRFVSSSGLFLAQELGFFKAEGLAPEFIFFDAAQPVAVAVASGDVAFGTTSITGGTLNLALKGVLKVVASQGAERKGYKGNALIVSSAAYAKGMTSLDKLTGASVAITQVGSSQHYMIGQIAEAAHVDMASLVIRPLQSIPNMIAAIRSGQVDATLLTPQFFRPLEQRGDVKLLAYFSDASGEIVAILGPSGCGKSTLLRILGGLERPDAGDVYTSGVAAPGTLNPLTYVFQDFALIPWMTIAGNVGLPLEHHPMPQADRKRRVEGALGRVNLAEFAGAFPRQLSGGMRQRASIARALAVDPAVLLMDEPLSALDAQTRELLMDDLTRLWVETQFTAVYVTHNIAEAVRLGHQIAVLSRRPGRVRAVVPIGIPLTERFEGMPELTKIRTDIWDLIREEALTADREIQTHA